MAGIRIFQPVLQRPKAHTGCDRLKTYRADYINGRLASPDGDLRDASGPPLPGGMIDDDTESAHRVPAPLTSPGPLRSIRKQVRKNKVPMTAWVGKLLGFVV